MSYSYRRSHTCGQLRLEHAGQTVELCGWVSHFRDHGNLVFIDLRDRFGITQVVFDPKHSTQAHHLSQSLRSEWVVYIKGQVRQREKGMENQKIQTGEIELEALELQVLSQSLTPPFELSDDKLHPNEELRLTYRYLDMRQAYLHQKLVTRHRVCQLIREHFNQEQFIEIHTPYLGKSTPEGARDYLVPSRVYPGKFYALPQSPQLFKQLLMMGGMDRYYQICPCFRDEDLRADRQPEFYQVDLEMSFAHPDDLFEIVERLFKKMLKEIHQIDLPTPFKRMSHQEAMEIYGSDKPDLRFDMPLVRLDDLIMQSQFDLAKQSLELGAISKGICVKEGGKKLSRKMIDGLVSFVAPLGLAGLAWLKKSSEGASGPLSKFFDQEALQALYIRMNMQDEDILFVGFEQPKTLNQAMDHLRRHLGHSLDLIHPGQFEFAWIVDFPMFQYDEKERRLVAEHHPFTSPKPEHLHLLESDPLKVFANCYDLVLNGYEISSGSQRIHDFELQRKVFEQLQLSQEDIEQRFGFFVKALQYGAPPHLGCALGLDRIVMILTETSNIRDVIAFPKTQNASDLLTQAPSTVDSAQLHELRLSLEKT
jgi:aspartyl-tRNA synthetase